MCCGAVNSNGFPPKAWQPRNDDPAVADRRQTLTVFGEGHRPWRFDLDTLDRLDDDDGDGEEKPPEDSPAGPTGFGWVLDGVLWNEVTGQPQLLLWPNAFRRTSWKHAPRSSPHSAGEINLAANTWHPCSQPTVRPRASSLRNRILCTTISPETAGLFGHHPGDGGTCSLAALSLTEQRALEIRKIPLVHDDAAVGTRRWLGGDRDERRHLCRAVSRSALPRFVAEPAGGGRLAFPRGSTAKRVDVAAGSSDQRPRRVPIGAERLHLESRDLSPDGQWFHAESATGEFTLSVSKSLDRVVQTHVAQIANLPAVRPLDNKQRLDNDSHPARRGIPAHAGASPGRSADPATSFRDSRERGTMNGKEHPIAHDFLD